MKKGLVFLLLVTFIIINITSCTIPGEAGEYTYRTSVSALGNNWNPHTWETSQDRAVMEYLTTPLVSVLPLNKDDGSFQWSFDMALDVKDVTESARGDLLRYGSDLPAGADIGDVKEGYVFEIILRPGMKFEDGSMINAEDFIESMKLLLDPKMKNNRANLYISGESALAGAEEYFNARVDFSEVGLYKTGELSFRYVTESYIEYPYFLASLSSHWLVNTDLYLSGIEESGKLKSTDYGTSKETTSSFGPYRISSHQGEKEMVLVRNENWYGWEKSTNGEIVSFTDALIDGEKKQQYMTTKIVINVIDNTTSKQHFTRGELTEWTPSATEYAVYRYSDSLYSMDETYTMSLFFNTDPDALRAMDKARGNRNSVCLSSADFRRGISLSINRSELALATEGYTTQYALLNDSYYYDIYNDPTATYRGTPEAKAAICRLYGVVYGEGCAFGSLDEAYNSISGYDISGAKEAFAEAFADLVSKGLYKEGEEIRIRVAFSKGALTPDDNQLISLLNSYINLAKEGSGFGKITLEPVGRVTNRYSAVPNGEYAIGYGAWGGAAFYPFRALRVYLDPDYENLHEAACWSPKEEMLSITLGGKTLTRSYTDWSRSLSGTGEYATADIATRLEILSRLEEGFLSFYYRIPLMSSRSSVLLSYQVENYTDKYNVMYGFGGLRLLHYHYDDYEWAEYVRASGKRLRYE